MACRIDLYTTLRVCLISVLLSAPGWASTVIVRSPGGGVSGFPLDAEATFTSSVSGTRSFIDITLTNYQSDPINISQALSGIVFTPNINLGSASLILTGTSVNLITIPDAMSPYIDNGLGYTGWKLSKTNGRLQIGGESVAYNASWPAHMILGDPPPNNIYAQADSTLTNSAYNPFVRRTARFRITAYGMTAPIGVSDASFYFGTNPTAFDGATVPEPTSFYPVAAILAGALVLRRRKRA